jgi:hypothetical protein
MTNDDREDLCRRYCVAVGGEEHAPSAVLRAIRGARLDRALAIVKDAESAAAREAQAAASGYAQGFVAGAAAAEREAEHAALLERMGRSPRTPEIGLQPDGRTFVIPAMTPRESAAAVERLRRQR